MSINDTCPKCGHWIDPEHNTCACEPLTVDLETLVANERDGYRGIRKSSDYAIGQQWDQWGISFIGYQFTIERKILVTTEGKPYLDYQVYRDGNWVFSGVCDVPADEVVDGEIIDILNDLFQLELY